MGVGGGGGRRTKRHIKQSLCVPLYVCVSVRACACNCIVCVCVCVCVCVHACVHMCFRCAKGLLVEFRVQFSPSTMWAPGMELGSYVLAAVTFICCFIILASELCSAPGYMRLSQKEKKFISEMQFFRNWSVKCRSQVFYGV